MPRNKVPTDLRQMLLDAGIGQYTADMSIPYMNMLPRTTDPYTQGVMQIVAGLQTLLNDRGANLQVDGGMGQDTLAELLVYSGPGWYDKSWAQLYTDVMSNEKWGGWKRTSRIEGMHQSVGDTSFTDVVTNPWVLLVAGAFAWWKWAR
jgi:hypothetical protein